MRFVKVILNLALFFTVFTGDYLVFRSKYSESFIFRALCDSTVHGVIGFFSAIIFFSHRERVDVNLQACMYNVLFCTLLSSLIDVDHFIVAKSIYLKDLTNLKQRGIFHCTTFWILITLIMFSYSYLAGKLNIYVLTYMVIIAFTSHHIRDGNRRGLWMYPYGHTVPLNLYLYVLLLIVIPNVLAVIYPVFKVVSHNTVVDYKMLI